MAEGALSGANLDRARKWAGKPAEDKEEDEGFFGNLVNNLNPIRQVQQRLEGTDNDLAKNVSGALNLFDPTKVVPAFAGQALKTGLETARLAPSLAALGYTAATGELAPGANESSPLSFLVNTEYMKNLADPNTSLGEKIGANVAAGSPLVSGVLQSGLDLGGRGALEAKSGVSRLPGQQMQSAEELARGTRMEGRTYGELARTGQAGETLLQDLLTVAPIARGLGGAAGQAGIISEGAASRIANAATAVERAPLAPVSIPLRRGYQGVQRAAAGETAFPGMATSRILGEGAPLEGLGQTVEAGAQNIGRTWRETGIRDRFFGTRAGLMDEEGIARPEDIPEGIEGNTYRTVFENLEAKAKGFDKGTPEYDATRAQIKNLEDALDAEARYETTYQLQREARGKAAAESGQKIRDVEVPEQFSNEAINKAFEGLDPQKYGDNYWVGLYDKAIGMWRDGVLALNPAWQGGNIVNNSTTAMTYGDVKGSWLTKQNLSRIFKEIKSPTEGTGAVLGSGQAGQFAPTQPTSRLGKVKQAMYNANQLVDDVSHAGVYLHKLDQLKASGMADDLAKAEAAKFANSTMGNFQNMSPFERDIMRRVAPFYAWSKHAAKMSLRELALRPEKISRVSTAAALAGGPRERREGAEFLESQTPLGGGSFLRLPGGAEQGAPAGLLENPLTNPAKLAGAVSPFLQLPLAAAGFNARKGEMISGAPGQSGLSRAAGYGINMLPGTKLIGDMVEGSPLGRGEHVIKGDVREPILAGGRPIADTKQSVGPIDSPLFRFLTGAQVDRPDVEGSVKRAKTAAKKAKKSAKNYEKGAKKTPKNSKNK